MQGEGRKHTASAVLHLSKVVLRAFFLRTKGEDSDSVFGKTTTATKKAKGYCRSNDHKCKNKSAFPPSGSPFVGDCQRSARTTKVSTMRTEVRKRRTIPLLSRSKLQGMHNQSPFSFCLARVTSLLVLLVLKTVAFLSCSIKFRFSRFCRQHHFR